MWIQAYLLQMKPYSNNLRERVAAACAALGATQTTVAARFCVSVSFVEKLRQRQRASGSVAALPHRSGPAPLLDAAARAELGPACASSPMPPWTNYACGWPPWADRP